MERLSAWLNGTWLHEAAWERAQWLVPAAQSVHILAIAMVFGAGLVLALRLAGATGTDWTPARWSRRLSPWIGGALAVQLASGAVLVVGEPERDLLNPNFQLKMVLVLLAAGLSWLLAHRLGKPGHAPGGADRLLAFLLLAFWLAIIAAGRWIGYS